MQSKCTTLLSTRTYHKLVKEHLRVVRACAEKNIPIVVLEFGDWGLTVDVLKREIDKVPRKALIIKPHRDGFIATKLDKTLKSFDANSLLLMGVNASYCVLETAKSAVRLRYKIITAEKLIADSLGDYEKEKSKSWYEQNGVFCDHSVELV